MKYYVKLTDHRTGSVKYRLHKCIDDYVKDKSICWEFSEAGAKRIAERNNKYLAPKGVEYSIEAVNPLN